MALRFHSAYCTLGVSHGQFSSCLLSILTSSAHWGTVYYCWTDAYCQNTPAGIAPFGGQDFIIILWYLAWHSQLPDSWWQTHASLVPELSCAIKPETQCIINGQKPLIIERRVHYTSHKILWLHFWGQMTGSPLPFPVSDVWPLQTQVPVSHAGMQGALTLLYPLMPSSLEDAPHQNLQAHSPHQAAE